MSPVPSFSLNDIITARGRSLRRLCFYTCLSFCPQWGGGIPACLAGFQAHTKGGSLGGSGLGEGVSRPTPKGEVEGDLVRLTAKGEVDWDLARGVSALGGACSGGCLLWGVPAPGGAYSGGYLLRGVEPPPDGYWCGRYTSYWNAFLLKDYLKDHKSGMNLR